MHIPDGFLDAKTAVATGGLAATGVAVALAGVRRTLPSRRVPLIGLAAAFIFAAQMLNFPVAGGTSGHLVGGVLAAVLLGPLAAVVVMTAVLILQCLMFADGGLTALGANLFNMALVAPVCGWAAYRLLVRATGETLRARLFAAAFAAWLSIVAAATACAGELALSGIVLWRAAFPAMAGIHIIIGLGEAAITALVVAAVARTRPELLASGPARGGYAGFAAAGLLVAAGLAVFVGPFACGWPDGLERAAEALGFAGRAGGNPAPLADYAVPGIGSSAVSTAVAGGLGTLAAFALAFLLARVLSAPGRPRARSA